MTLTGTAAMAIFESSALGDTTHAYNLTWSVASYSPITEFRLFFRQQPSLESFPHLSMYQPNDVQMNVIPKINVSISLSAGMLRFLAHFVQKPLKLYEDFLL